MSPGDFDVSSGPTRTYAKLTVTGGSLAFGLVLLSQDSGVCEDDTRVVGESSPMISEEEFVPGREMSVFLAALDVLTVCKAPLRCIVGRFWLE